MTGPKKTPMTPKQVTPPIIPKKVMTPGIFVPPLMSAAVIHSSKKTVNKVQAMINIDQPMLP